MSAENEESPSPLIVTAEAAMGAFWVGRKLKEIDPLLINELDEEQRELFGLWLQLQIQNFSPRTIEALEKLANKHDHSRFEVLVQE